MKTSTRIILQGLILCIGIFCLSYRSYHSEALAEARYEIRLPSIHFKYNSTAYDTLEAKTVYDSAYQIPAVAVNWLARILKENPSIIIELSAHCSMDETNPDQLSQQRAEKVRTDLIKAGIAEGRLVAKGYGTLKLLVKPEIIDKAKTKKEKQALHAKNRRCIFRILSWDYISK